MGTEQGDGNPGRCRSQSHTANSANSSSKLIKGCVPFAMRRKWHLARSLRTSTASPRASLPSLRTSLVSGQAVSIISGMETLIWLLLGDHSICLQSNSSSGYFSSTHIKLYLDIAVGTTRRDPSWVIIATSNIVIQSQSYASRSNCRLQARHRTYSDPRIQVTRFERPRLGSPKGTTIPARDRSYI